jgi:hypothetical protein
VRVPVTRDSREGPEILASLPTITLIPDFPDCCRIKEANAVVKFTISTGVKPSPGFPPMVPRIPEIDLISVIVFCLADYNKLIAKIILQFTVYAKIIQY